MDEKIEDLYKKWREIDSLIKRRTEDQNEVYNKLIKTELGKFYFGLTDEQKESFKRIYSSINSKDYYDSDIYKYCNFKDIIEAYHEMLLDTKIEVLCNADFPFKNRELAIYIKDGVDTYNPLTDESTKDLEVSDEIKLFIQNIINDLYGFKDELTADDIPLIKVIYEKIKKNNEDYAENIANITIMEDNIFKQVKRIHKLDKSHSVYKENRRPFIEKIKESIASTELEIKNSDSGFKYLLLYAIEAAKYEVSLLEGKRVTTILKEIDESNMSESEKDYKKDALVEAYYNLTNIDFRKQSKEYFDNDNDICYATFETANSEINKRLIKMRQG